jgi:hypothetical protein
VDAIIARGEKPTAYATYDLSVIAKQNDVPPLPNWLRRGGPGND